MELNNREISSLIWLVVFLSFLLWKSRWKSLNEVFKNLLVAFFNPKIQVVLLWGILWIILCVQIFRSLGAWDFANLKTTWLWGTSYAFVALMGAPRVTEERLYFKKAIREIFAVTAVVVFIAEAYSFSIVAELIFVPFLVLMSMIQAFSAKDPDHAQVHKLTSFMLVIAGLIYIGNGVYRATMDFDGFSTVHNLREFFVPLALSVLFLPYIFAISIIMAYETTGSVIRVMINDKSLQSYAMRQALQSFRFDLNGLQRWKRSIGLFRPQSKEQIQDLIAEIKTSKKRERQQQDISPELGWNPSDAIKFLSDKGLETDDYHRTFENQWWASSRVLKVENESLFPGDVVYYVSGDDIAVKRLKLTLNVFDRLGGTASDVQFFTICKALLERSTGHSPVDLLHQGISGEKIDQLVGGRRVRIVKDDHVHPKMGGYLRTLIIEHSSDYRSPYEA